ncbi:hypothetical protein GFL93_09345 [Rhizobium leguminosarum bv. viciae]|uniref:HNH endonuclease signature motif containing protein n=1 Tax=Rhizobium TaxID=379 RepID=UPI0014424A9F|nr:HNH endonuclease signature motif containing protein [Rhizobium leguminosarum]NKK06075.1 hypothetical protein [Rhizobium leguminosarum bv. viciae]
MVKLLQDLGISEGWEFSRIGALRLRKQGFTAAQRWAVWIVHGERCYLDGHPIDLQSMQVDHVIPESLVEEPERLAQVLHDFGLAPDFDLNSYENWMPACGTHNNLKRAKVFTPTPLIQMHLERAADKAEQAREIERQSISRVAFAKASNVVMREAEALGISTEEFVSFLNQLIDARSEDDWFNADALMDSTQEQLPEGLDRYLREILRPSHNNSYDIQLTPTVSISFEKALQLTGRSVEM